MATESHFLNLPPELRIIIYQYYLSNDGYIYNPRTRKLRDANNDPIDLRLMYTCRLVAREMDGIALGINTITFSTFSSTELRAHAFFQAETLRNLHHIKQRMFRRLHPCFTEDLKSRVGQVYPEFMPLFDNIDSDWDIDRMGHAPSILHKALDYTIQLASSHPQFAQISSECSRMHPRVWDEFMPDFNTVNSFPYEPWKTPTRDYLQRSVSFCGSRLWVSDDRWSMMPFSSKLSFSAAAASIQFLESIPASTRAHIRRVVLNEDELSVSNPQCHARGLIPFCQENPRLRIERRANLWKNVFLRPLCQNNDSFVLEPVRYTSKSEVIDQVSATITSSVALWIVEALALIPSGMPADSFSLVLDGDPLPDECAQMFKDVILRDATWQAAMEESEKRGFLPQFNLFYNADRYNYCTFKHFPAALADIVNKRSSVVRCNFDLGEHSILDIEKMVKERRGWSVDLWRGKNWLNSRLINWGDYSPLLGWMRLVSTIIKVKGF